MKDAVLERTEGSNWENSVIRYLYYQSNSVVLVEDRYLNQLEVYAVRQPLKV